METPEARGLFFWLRQKKSKGGNNEQKACGGVGNGMRCLAMSGPVVAHFGMLIPSQATVSKADPKTVDLQVSFSHPMEMVGMDMAKPKAFGVMAGGSKEDLLGSPEAGPGDGQGGLVLAVHP